LDLILRVYPIIRLPGLFGKSRKYKAAHYFSAFFAAKESGKIKKYPIKIEYF
jgi:hypothetical protein